MQSPTIRSETLLHLSVVVSQRPQRFLGPPPRNLQSKSGQRRLSQVMRGVRARAAPPRRHPRRATRAASGAGDGGGRGKGNVPKDEADRGTLYYAMALQRPISLDLSASDDEALLLDRYAGSISDGESEGGESGGLCGKGVRGHQQPTGSGTGSVGGRASGLPIERLCPWRSRTKRCMVD